MAGLLYGSRPHLDLRYGSLGAGALPLHTPICAMVPGVQCQGERLFWRPPAELKPDIRYDTHI